MIVRMINPSSKRGLIIGAVIFAFLVFAGGVGLWLFSRNTDNRSQASADHVAQMKVLSQKNDAGLLVHNLAIDTSQMKAGTTVTDFSARLFISTKRFTPPEGTPKPRPSMVQTTPQPKPSMVYWPTGVAVTGVKMMVTPTPKAVLGVSTEEAGQAFMPEKDISETPDRVITKEQPQPGNILAKSTDGRVMVTRVGNYGQFQNLSVQVSSDEKGYFIDLSGQVSAKDLSLQKAFATTQPVFAILINERTMIMSSPEVQKLSIRGYLPGMRTIVELTKPLVVKATEVPEKPPVVVKTCRVTADCPTGYRCVQPPMPTCPAGKKCPQMMLSWQCVLSPTRMPVKVTPTRISQPPTKTTPINVTGRPQIIIKSVQ